MIVLKSAGFSANKLFGVSLDYLLGRSDIQTPNEIVKTFCDYLGLDESTVEQLHSLLDGNLRTPVCKGHRSYCK